MTYVDNYTLSDETVDPFSKISSNTEIVEEGDELIGEIDVTLSHEFLETIKLIQYPLRPNWRSYDETLMKEVRYKFGVNILEMDYFLPKYEIEDQKYNTTIVYDSEGRVIPNPTKQMTSHTIRSSSIPVKSNYAVGVYKGDSFILLPISDILQMRPDFSYIDKGTQKKSESNDIVDNDLDLGLSSDSLKPIQIQVRGQESEKALASRLKSYAYLKQLENEDVFKKLSYVNKDSTETKKMFESIISPKLSNVEYENINVDEYINNIIPPNEVLPSRDENFGNDENRIDKPIAFTLDQIKNLPLENQIELLLRNAHVLTLDQIMTYCNCDKETEVINVLQKKAELAQGVWVIKSELVFKGRKAASRDWILAYFGSNDDNLYIKRSDVSQKCNISTDIAKEIMADITDLVPGRGWKLKKAPDYNFIKKHSALHKNNKKKWENWNKKKKI